METRRPDRPAPPFGGNEPQGPGKGDLDRREGLELGMAGCPVHRVHGPELEGNRVGAYRCRVALQSASLGDRRRAARQVLSLWKDPAVYRLGELPGCMEPEV